MPSAIPTLKGAHLSAGIERIPTFWADLMTDLRRPGWGPYDTRWWSMERAPGWKGAPFGAPSLRVEIVAAGRGKTVAPTAGVRVAVQHYVSRIISGIMTGCQLPIPQCPSLAEADAGPAAAAFNSGWPRTCRGKLSVEPGQWRASPPGK